MSGAADVRAGGAYLELGTKDTALDKGLAKARKKLQDFGASVRRAATLLTGVGVAMAAPLVAAVKAFGEEGDKIAKIARRTGADIGFLTEMGHVATLAGQDVETLERSLRGMQRATLDAKRGSLEIVESLEMLGIDTKKWIELPLEEQFSMVLEKLGSMENASLKAGIAMKIFGRAGTGIIPVADMGAEAIKQAAKEADIFGIVLTEVGSKAAEDYIDWMHRLKMAKLGLKYAIAEQLMPTVMEYLKSFVSYITAVKDYLKVHPELLNAWVQMIKTIFMAVGAMLALVAAIWLLTSSTTPILLIVVALFGILDALGIIDTGFGAFAENIKIGSQTIKGWWDWLGDMMAIAIEQSINEQMRLLVRFLNYWKNMIDNIKLMWHEFLNLIGKESDEELAANIAKRDANVAARKKKFEEGVMKQDAAIAAAWDDAEKRAKEDSKKTGIFADLKAMADAVKAQLEGLTAPVRPTFGEDPLDSYGVPAKGGVHGFFGAALASENIGEAFGKKDIDKEQLDEQKKQTTLIQKVVDNTTGLKPVPQE